MVGHYAPPVTSVTIYQLKTSNITENFNILKKKMSWVSYYYYYYYYYY